MRSKPGARGPARRRAAEVLVDDLDLATSRAARAGRAWRTAAPGSRGCAEPDGPRTGGHRAPPCAPGAARRSSQRSSPSLPGCGRRAAGVGDQQAASSARSLLAVSAPAGRSIPAPGSTLTLGSSGRGRVGGPASEADDAGGAWRSPRWQSGDAICPGQAMTRPMCASSPPTEGPAASAAPDSAATGSADARIERHAAASSIQTGISWTRITRGVDQTAPRRCAGRPLDHLADMNQPPSPWMPRVGDRHLVASSGTVGLVV